MYMKMENYLQQDLRHAIKTASGTVKSSANNKIS